MYAGGRAHAHAGPPLVAAASDKYLASRREGSDRRPSAMDDADDGESYRAALASTRAEDLSDVESLDVVRVWAGGRDRENLPVVVLTPAHLGDCDRERAFRLFLREADAVAAGPYRLVLVHSGRALGPWLAVWAARRAAASLPRRFAKNLAAVSVVHPDLFVRAAAYALRPFLSAKLWHKVQMVDRIEELELDGVFARGDSVSLLPASCRRWESHLEGEASIVRDQARAAGLPAASAQDESRSG
jgi:hypothetical protein